jgi:hypothetical protein
MTDDEKVDGMIRKLAEGYNQPPETPRAELWERIVGARTQWRERVRVGGTRARLRWVGWAAGLAATLVMGVAIGRFTAGGGSKPVQPPPAIAAANGPVPAAYRVAVGDHLNRVETFLAVFSADAGGLSARNGDLEQPVRQLLQQTRLLRDSPAGQDVALGALLDDIELVLVQIAAYAEAGTTEDLGFIEQGIKDRSVLLRLRAARPGRAERLAMGGTL